MCSSFSSPIKYFLFLLILCSCLWVLCYCNEDEQKMNDDDDSLYTVDNFTYSHRLHHYAWTYIKVELSSWFTMAIIAIDSDVEPDLKKSSHKGELPMVCVRDGGPPLPDISKNSLNELVLDQFFYGSFYGVGNCYVLQRNMKLTFTSDQISPEYMHVGFMYVGFFNGIGPVRTQSKMINRGSEYFFKANVTILGCNVVSGRNCNQIIHRLSCSERNVKNHHEQAQQLTCKNHSNDTCQQDFEPKIYSLSIEAQQFVISARKIKFTTRNKLMGYLRYGAVPKENMHDFSFDLTKGSFKIQLPKIGQWYLLIKPLGFSNMSQESDVKICYSLEWRVFTCSQGKAGPNCSWHMHFLKEYETENSIIYLPYHRNVSFESLRFSLEPLLSKSDKRLHHAWTYFLLYVLDGFSSYNLNIHLSSDQEISFELYFRFRGIPSRNIYDYYYSNQTSNSNNGSMFKLYDISKKSINAYLVYPREGPWILGLRHFGYKDNPSPKTNVSISIKSCPNQCSGHGQCNFYSQDRSSYYACDCDRNHGGFDCSIELVSQADEKWHAFSLIASNVAALFPAFWALGQKAFAEWVIFICSGVASGLYHSCDVGYYCVLDYNCLKFMDFWLSFMAVVSTFLFLTNINEYPKTTIYSVAWIVTALMALNEPTSSKYLVIVPMIGAVGLIIGWLIEFLNSSESKSESLRSYLNILGSWHNVREIVFDVAKAIYSRFRWWFIIAGFVALGVAAISWTAETIQTYWKWHSIWHVSIYMSSFLFLCSKAVTKNSENYLVVEDQTSLPSPSQ